ncbi:MAG: 2-oxoglutarate dehydrogenase complex dihydrolipoyllysine-residue succinyltransferase [Thermomicrobiales bacterium]
MAIEIKVPPLGESLVDAIVGSWLKGEGDEISRGETILELETDKVNLEVTAEEDGVLSAIHHQEGDTVTVGEVLGTLEAGAGDSTGANGSASAAEATPESAPAPAPTPTPSAPAPAPAAVATEAASSDSSEDVGGRAAPAVRRLAEEHAIDLSKVHGTAGGGRITRDDLFAYIAQQGGKATSEASAPAAAAVIAPPAAPTPGAASTSATSETAPASESPRAGEEKRVRLSRRRQTIATRLVAAQHNAAMLTTFNEVDMSAIMDVRKRRKDAFKEKNGVNLGFMSFFTKASIGALKAFPQVNSELQGVEQVLKEYYDIGVAVGVEEGLVVPVVRNADRKSFAQIEQEIVDLATKARNNTIALADLQGGTFTITNGGVFGSLLSTPILNAPQVAILGMHTIQQRPVVRDGEIVIRPMMYLALSYDHRVVDGREAVQFLVKIKDLLEDPEALLLEG